MVCLADRASHLAYNCGCTVFTTSRNISIACSFNTTSHNALRSSAFQTSRCTLKSGSVNDGVDVNGGCACGAAGTRFLDKERLLRGSQYQFETKFARLLTLTHY